MDSRVRAIGVACALMACFLALATGAHAAAGAPAQIGPPSSEPATDLRADKLDGPFLDDSTPGRGAGLPLAIAGCAAFAVVVTIVVRSRRTGRGRGARPPVTGAGGSGA